MLKYVNIVEFLNGCNLEQLYSVTSVIFKDRSDSGKLTSARDNASIAILNALYRLSLDSGQAF